MHSANTLLRARRLLVACAALATTATTLHAGDDFGLWGEVGVTKSFQKKYALGAEFGYRANDNLHSSSRFDLGFSAAYKPTKFLKLSTGFVYIENHSLKEAKPHYGNKSGELNGYNIDHAYWQARYRWYFDVTGKAEWNRFSFSLRERYQYTHNAPATCDRTKYRGKATAGYDGDKYFDGTGYWGFDEQTTDRKRAKDKHYLRSRVGVEYNIRHCPVTPYATYEISNNPAKSFEVEKHRVTVGIDWKIQKKHTVSVGYIYTNSIDKDDDGDGNLHALSVGYNFKF